MCSRTSTFWKHSSQCWKCVLCNARLSKCKSTPCASSSMFFSPKPKSTKKTSPLGLSIMLEVVRSPWIKPCLWSLAMDSPILTHKSWRSALETLFRTCFTCCPSMYSMIIEDSWYVYHVNQRRRHPSGFGFMHQLRLMHRAVTSNPLIQCWRAVPFWNSDFNDYFSFMPIQQGKGWLRRLS